MPKTPPTTKPQKFLNGEIHNWYNLVLGYSDHLVAYLINRLQIQKGQTILDPFCGSGTTLIEAKKLGINSIGIDANPSSVFASKVKTNWKINNVRLLELLDIIQKTAKHRNPFRNNFENDSTYKYLNETGMVERGWISPKPLKRAILIKNIISNLETNHFYKNMLLLALIAEIVNGSSNVKFGPEIYCGPVKSDCDVLSGFSRRVKTMADDIQKTKEMISGNVKVIQGDSRDCDKLVEEKISAVICSPPYPSEHDYTRNSRLELAFLGAVSSRESLQKIKKTMIRSHTKGIYKNDSDGLLTKDNTQINKLVKEIEKRIISKSHGFARLYPVVIREYFGGIIRHLINLKDILSDDSVCAYVLGDQSSYLQVHIPTALVLSSIIEETGYKFVEILHWRSRRSSTTSKLIDENILIFRNRN